MIRNLTLGAIALLLFLASTSKAQFIPYGNSYSGIEKKLLKDYDTIIFFGDSLNGKPHGTWIAANYNDTAKIYKQVKFNEGLPVGEWTTYYPDGKTIRKQLKYDDQNRLISWSKFSKNIKIIEVHNDSGFSQRDLNIFENQEDLFFETELNEYVTTGMSEGPYSKQYYQVFYYFDIDKATESFIRLIEVNRQTCYLKIYYNTGMLRRETKYQLGKVLWRKSFFYNRKNVLTRIEHYNDKNLVKIDYIDKDGNVKKSKSIH